MRIGPFTDAIVLVCTDPPIGPEVALFHVVVVDGQVGGVKGEVVVITVNDAVGVHTGRLNHPHRG